MPISKNFFATLNQTQDAHRQLALGLHTSVIKDISDGEDQLGPFFCLVLKQVDTGLCTAPAIKDEIRFKDIAKIHRGENRFSKNGYAIREGDGWVRFFAQIEDQFPHLKELSNWGEELEALQKEPVKVWYTRSQKGYLNVHFSEAAYQFAIKGGEEGDPDQITSDESRTLNEDCPF